MVTDNQIWGDIVRNEPNVLATFTYEKYIARLRASRLGTVKQLLDDIARSEEHVFRVKERGETFVVCFRSQKLIYVLCDDASTPQLERIVRDQPLPAIKELLCEVEQEN
jgi:hypothetical protein